MHEIEKYFECRKHMFETKVGTLSYFISEYNKFALSDHQSINLDFGRRSGKSYFHAWLMNKFENEQIPYISIFLTHTALNYFKEDYRQYGKVNEKNVRIYRKSKDWLSNMPSEYIIYDNHILYAGTCPHEIARTRVVIKPKLIILL